MKKLISMFMILALVFTTTMAPAVSHAMPHNDSKAVQTTKTEAAKGHDCHGHGETKAATDKTAHNDKDPSGKCCDKGMCKCVGGNCHNGFSGIFGNSSGSLHNFASTNTSFGYAEEHIESAYLSRLKRPPKA